MAAIKARGAQLITLLALNDDGMPAFDRVLSGKFSEFNIPVFACSPDQFPGLMATAIKKDNIQHWMSKEGILNYS